MMLENILMKTCIVSGFKTLIRKYCVAVRKENIMFAASSSMQRNHKKLTVCVEGNIASGKTSFLKYFDGTPDVEVFDEPVEKWRNIDGENVLAKMYEDPTRWSLTLQTYVQLTMLQNHLKPQEKQIKLMERSIYSAKYCFVENLHNCGKMQDLEYAVLSEWFNWIVGSQELPMDLIVYLQTTPETVHDRIKKRCRKEEQTIPLEYLTQLHHLHEDWLIHQKKFTVPSNVLVLDANLGLEEMHKVFEENRDKLMCNDLCEININS